MHLFKIIRAWQNRALPIRLRSLKGCQMSYSQFGEDLIADAIFRPGYSTGFFIDVGCFDPIKWSNTYRFYLKGWRGIGIDPNSNFVPEWARYRKHDVFLNLAVTDKTAEVLYATDEYSPQENKIVADVKFEHSIKAQLVKADRLDNILLRHLAPDTTIDLMSVDCEGHDLVVLKSGDFNRHRPHVLIVEDHDRGEHTAIDEYCASLDYVLRGLTAWSKIFVDRHWRR